MPLIVQKFGGSSVATPEKIKAAARKAIRAQQQGNQVVMVVSAMGDTTDELLDLADRVCERPPAREMDMLLSTGEQVSVALMAMAIHSLGAKAVSMTGAQINIKTDAAHTNARIRSISTDRVQRWLDDGNIVIAAGFQGIDDDFNITTLGRGGSDTTAVALAAVLNADSCEIYTDVDGVYTTDPRLLPEARQVERISYDEMLELASLGAGVMHNRSIEFAKKFGTPIHVRSSVSDAPGSMIVAQPEFADRPVCGAAMMSDEARISVLGVPDRPGVSLQIFSAISARNIGVDMIVQNVGENGLADISFTVPKRVLSMAVEAVQQALEQLGAGSLSHDDDVAKISVVGLGMARQAGVAQTMFAALAADEINIQMITTSEIKISVLVDRTAATSALRSVHRAFDLDKPSSAGLAPLDVEPAAANAAEVASRLRGASMEALFIEDILLDQSQGRVTISGIPDVPGIAAQVFKEVAAVGVNVDMIVQSHGSHADHADLSFTVPRGQVEKAADVSRRLVQQFSCEGVTSCPNIAKLSIRGVGLRSHTGAMIRLFRALAEAGINIDMVSTSEVRVNVVVAGQDGERALASLQAVFADALG